MKYQVYKQPFIFRNWYRVDAEWYKRLLFKLSFGRFGRMEYLQAHEQEMVRYFTGYTEWSNIPKFKSGNTMPTHINCRCSTVKL